MEKDVGGSSSQSLLFEKYCIHLSILVTLSNWPEAANGRYGITTDGNGLDLKYGIAKVYIWLQYGEGKDGFINKWYWII